jgi:purine-binding chemotaxis protein CheW
MQDGKSWRDAARAAARGPGAEADAERRGAAGERAAAHVAFSAAGETYALAAARVREMLAPPPHTALPHAPRSVLGLVNLRGRLVPVIDLRARLGLPDAAAGAERRLLVCEAGGDVVGLLVDALEEVFPARPRDIEPIPPLGAAARSEALAGVVARPRGPALLLDLDRLLGSGPLYEEPAA